MVNKLKTLKDIDKFLPEDPYCMMDTLIDPIDKRKLNSKYHKKAKKRYEEHGFISQNDLKQEAIKHIKDLREEQVDCIKYRFANDFAANCFKSFFNITDKEIDVLGGLDE